MNEGRELEERRVRGRMERNGKIQKRKRERENRKIRVRDSE